MDQGFGLGSGNPIFNRHQASCTRFLQLPILQPVPGSTTPPASLILHARYGGAVGDLASYDCFTLGGPHSVRGYNVGELATCRRFVEGSAEVRLPVLNRQVSPSSGSITLQKPSCCIAWALNWSSNPQLLHGHHVHQGSALLKLCVKMFFQTCNGPGDSNRGVGSEPCTAA